MTSLLLALGGAGSASAAAGPSLFADGLHVPTGGLVDPDNRLWVSDHNGGFCRVTSPDDRGPGTIDHPSTPGAPSTDARTCLGGILPDAAPGPDAAGTPAFYDPTPELGGSGDELALIPDGAAPSMDVWRAHWNPHTKLFEADPSTDVIAMDADSGETRPRPTAVSVAPDGNAYVVFQRSSSIQRIVEPDGPARVELVGVTSDDVGSQAIAAGYGPFGPLGPPTVYVAESTGAIRQIAGARGTATTTTSASSYSVDGTSIVGTLAYKVTDTIAGRGTLYAGTADAVVGGPAAPDRLLQLNADALPTFVAGGFSTVGGVAIRPADGSMFVLDDPAIAIDGEPLGRGRAFIIGDPFTQIVSGPSQKAGQPALDAEYTANPTPTFTYAGEFDRQCSLTPASAAANQWQACDSATYTAANLADGRYRFAVRSVNGTRIGQAASRYFTLDTTAPAAKPVIVNPAQNSNHLRSPRFVFDSDDASEPEFGYVCKIDGGEYAACDEGLADSRLADGEHTLQIKLVDGAGNVGTAQSDSTPTREDDPETTEVDEHALTVGDQPTTFTVGADPATGDTDPTPYATMSHPDSSAVYAEGLHVSTGALEDPAGRVWVADHNAGFCRVTDPTIDGAGQIEHPSLPGRPRTEPRTCLGGLLPDAGPGADAAGPPTFVDPTPKRPGNGDEVVLIADGFAQSDFIVRFRWDPGTKLFEHLDEIHVPAVERPGQTRPRPVTTQIGPDPDGVDGPKQPSVFFTNKRDIYIGRIDQPASDGPSVHVAGFVAQGDDRAEVLAVGQRTHVVTPAIAATEETEEVPAVTEKRPVIYVVGAAGIDRLENPRVEGEPDAPTTLRATSVAVPGLVNAGALTYDLQRDVLYVGTAEALVTNADGTTTANPGTDRFLRVDPATMEPAGTAIGGFSMIGGIGIRNDGRILVVDDKALLDEAEPPGKGLMYQIGTPSARITSGPSDPENNALDPSFTSGSTPSFGLAGDMPRECWVRPVGSTAAPSWQDCSGATTTTPALGDGEYKLTVRATGDPVPADIADTTRYIPQTMRFTVDRVAPDAPRVASVKPLASDNVTNAEPFFTFEGEAGVRYDCSLNANTASNNPNYNKSNCRPGRTFPRSGTPRVQNGSNTMRIRATDKAGNRSPNSAVFTFQADTRIPTVTISSPAENQVTGTEARFVFRASQTANTAYGCRIDGTTFTRCDRPSDAGGPGKPYAIENLSDGSVAVTYRGLSAGEHHFQVHASDTHNNVSPNAARNIRVDTSAPVALVDAPAPNETTGRSTTLVSHIDPTTIGEGETNTLACTLDGQAMAECDESIPVSNLNDGLHTFTIQATDSAGNVGPVGSRTWRVDGVGPVITVRQQGNGTINPPTFTITTDEPATMLCRYDDRPWQDCAVVDGTGLQRFSSHRLFVTGTDMWGNVSTASDGFNLGLPSSAVTVVNVPSAIAQSALRAGGLPVTFTADEQTALARFRIFRVVDEPAGTTATAAGAARAAATKASAKKATKRTYKLAVQVKRDTPKAGVYRRRLTERSVRLLKPGLYRIETRLKDKAGTYADATYSMVRVKKSAKKKK
ncbi:MAG TPA: hypothetical protein VMY78_07560 [Solirubrobacteraceae bacterium]|nr:hypothetical protein [Solirubrobacteraceae bacterium]